MKLLGWQRKGVYAFEGALDGLRADLPRCQVLASLNINLLSFLGGLVVSSSSVITDKLQELSIERSKRILTQDDISWIGRIGEHKIV